MNGRDQELRRHSTLVEGRAARYGVAGEGDPVVFVHGWGLSHRSYRVALHSLVRSGVQVFLDEAQVPQPVTLIGHSFGGGVAQKTAHDHPRAVSRLVLVNSVGGSVWKADKSMRDRPLWDWGLHLSAGALSPRTFTRVVPGDHGWLIADPGLFAEVFTNVVVGGPDTATAVGQ